MQRIAEGTLPCRRPIRTTGEISTSATCAVCLERIQARKLEIETEGEAGQVHTFHPECFAAWEVAFREAGGT